jgi:predicted kinase
MTRVEPSECVIVSGMPGAGKSTVGALAARLLPRAALIKGDDVNLMIRSGAVWFRGEPRDEAARQYELCKRNMCALANNFVDYGFMAFMDTVLQDRAMLDLLLALLSPRPVRLVILAPGVEVCRQRNATRDPSEQFAFDGYDQLDADMKRDSAMSPGGSTRPRLRRKRQPSSSSVKSPSVPACCREDGTLPIAPRNATAAPGRHRSHS